MEGATMRIYAHRYEIILTMVTGATHRNYIYSEDLRDNRDLAFIVDQISHFKKRPKGINYQDAVQMFEAEKAWRERLAEEMIKTSIRLVTYDATEIQEVEIYSVSSEVADAYLDYRREVDADGYEFIYRNKVWDSPEPKELT